MEGVLISGGKQYTIVTYRECPDERGVLISGGKQYTVEPPIRDPDDLSVKDTVQSTIPIGLVHFELPRRRQPPYKGQHGQPQSVLYSEASVLIQGVHILGAPLCSSSDEAQLFGQASYSHIPSLESSLLYLL